MNQKLENDDSIYKKEYFDEYSNYFPWLDIRRALYRLRCHTDSGKSF